MSENKNDGYEESKWDDRVVALETRHEQPIEKILERSAAPQIPPPPPPHGSQPHGNQPPPMHQRMKGPPPPHNPTRKKLLESIEERHGPGMADYPFSGELFEQMGYDVPTLKERKLLRKDQLKVGRANSVACTLLLVVKQWSVLPHG